MHYRIFNRIILSSYIFVYGTLAAHGESRHLSPTDDAFEFWTTVLYCLCLVCFSGFCSGATQGLLTIDELSLEIMERNGTPEERQIAEALIPVVKQHHLLLSTLLISNAFANETLPIMLHVLVPDWAAILISSIFVVLFGEVVPSAFTTGPNQLKIGVAMIPYVKFLQMLLYLICYPLSQFLDWLLGTQNRNRYPIRDIRALLNLHVGEQEGQQDNKLSGANDQNKQNNSQYNQGPLTREQLRLIHSTMDLREELVTKQYIDIKKVFMVSSEEKFNREFMNKLRVKGFSRIPVYNENDKSQILGTFNTKQILKYSEVDYGKSIRNLVQIQEPLIVYQDINLLQLFMLFQEKRKTMAFISDQMKPQVVKSLNEIDNLCLQPGRQEIGKIIGITCLNDVFEEVLDSELKDNDIHGTLRHDHSEVRVRSKTHALGTIHEEGQEGTEKGLEEMLLNKKK